MHLLLRRTENTPDGVFGQLFGDAQHTEPDNLTSPVLYTMEDDWKNNQRRESSIPAGTYTIRRTVFQRHGYETFEITNVPGRDRILLHTANSEEDVEGCVGLGLRRGYLDVPDEDATGHPVTHKRAVLESKAAFTRFMQFMSGVQEATLTVEWADGVAH